MEGLFRHNHIVRTVHENREERGGPPWPTLTPESVFLFFVEAGDTFFDE